MTDPAILAALEKTWPAAGYLRVGPWIIREGKGGGQRVSAATLEADGDAFDVTVAEQAMRDLGQAPLFMLRDGEKALDTNLSDRGYVIHDPVVIYAARCADLAKPAPDLLAGFAHWPPLAITGDLWLAGGIRAERLQIMNRVSLAKAVVLGRADDRPAGAAFVAVDHTTAVLHALYVLADHRGQGVGKAILRHAAIWALEQQAERLVLAVTVANRPARALYDSLGLQQVGQYHYRVAP